MVSATRKREQLRNTGQGHAGAVPPSIDQTTNIDLILQAAEEIQTEVSSDATIYMAKTRDGGVIRRPVPLPPIPPKVAGEQIPYTALECQRRGPRAGDEVQEHQEVIPGPDFAVADDAPPCSPEDTSVLTTFEHHVATRLWHGEDRGELKVVTGGRKLSLCNRPHPQIEQRVRASQLEPLLSSYYSEVDKGILSAFVERWHSETSSFHLPVGEITITLDDVSSLLHLPIRGAFWTHPGIDKVRAITELIMLLGVSVTDAITETERSRGPRVRLSWLREVYTDRCQDQRWDEATRAFLLHLVGCTIFADKSANSVDVSYLDLFRNLSSCSNYAWGVAALTYMYEHLRHGCYYQTKQLGGYMTLLQAWIFEHFPTMGCRHLTEDYSEDQPRARRWTPTRGGGRVSPHRRELDELTMGGVCWMPYGAHRGHRPLEEVSMFSGYIRCGRWMYAHLPERVVRQYGYAQDIPRLPTEVTGLALSVDDVDLWWVDFVHHVAIGGLVSEYPGQCTDRYMPWFQRISHPYIMPQADRDHARVPDSKQVRMSEQQPIEMSSSSIDLGEDLVQLLYGACVSAGDLIQQMIDRRIVIEGTECWQLVHQALGILRSAEHDVPSSSRKRRRTGDTKDSD